MIIKELSLAVFCKLFTEHDGILTGIGFTKNGTVDLLFTTAMTWYVSRNAETGVVTVWSVESDERTHTFTLNPDDFNEIVIC